MRFSPLTFAVALAIPASVFALNYSDATGIYKDASSFSRAEKAGIDVLTNLGVVKGNDDGTFAASRTLNRAEFAKIALTVNDSIEVISSDAENCFPDVHASDWFSRYVCLGKKRGIVKGYPDGKFHPERAVNYAEAIKMLSVTFYFSSTEKPGDQWYSQYVRASEEFGTLLPGNLALDALITRGQMARLAAAYRAYMEGELSLYRQAEQGKTITSSSSSIGSCVAKCADGYEYRICTPDGHPINYVADPCLTHSASSSSSSTVSSSSSSVSSPSSSSSTGLFPSISHFMTAEAATPPLLDGTFLSQDEDGEIRFVTLTLRREVRSLSGLTLIDATGKEAGKLKLALDDPTHRIWKGEYASGGYILPKGVPVAIGVKAYLKKDGVTSAELFETEDFRIQLLGKKTSASIHLVPSTTHYPSHQAALGRIQWVKNGLEATGTLKAGLRRQIASFAFSGAITSPGATVRLDGLTIHIQSTGVALSNFKIGGSAEIQQADCGIDSGSSQTLSCSLIPESMSVVNGTRVLGIFANVSVLSGSSLPALQLSLEAPGTMVDSGVIRWSDGAGRFNWVEGTAPLAVGTRWSVTK